jgi:hypothetical protein
MSTNNANLLQADQMSYKKKNLLINTDLDEIEDECIYEIDERNSNNFRFKTYINGIVKIQNLQDFIIRLSVVTTLFIIDCPHLIMDWYFLDDNILYTKSYIYISVSMTERILLGLITYYMAMTEDLDEIYNSRYNITNVPKLIVIGKIEVLWSKYYSLIGIVLAAKYYFENSYLNTTYVYILCFSILKLIILKILGKKINQ